MDTYRDTGLNERQVINIIKNNEVNKADRLLSESHINLCINIAHEAHKDQKRWGGNPYTDHLYAVAEIVRRVTDNDWMAVSIAWLHDFGEDTDYTQNDLVAMGVDDYVAHVVFNELTHDKKIDYYEYIKRINTPEGIIVKMADMANNSSDLKNNDYKNDKAIQERYNKYQLAIMYLECKLRQEVVVNWIQECESSEDLVQRIPIQKLKLDLSNQDLAKSVMLRFRTTRGPVW